MQIGSITTAAFAGFRLTRERPRVILVWAILSFLFNLGEGVFAAATAGPDVMRILQIAGQPTTNPNEVVAIIARIMPTYVTLLTSNMVFAALMLGAANRAMSDPHEDRFGSMRLGVAELRQFGLLLQLFMIGLGAYLVLAIVGSVIGALVAMASGPPAGILVAMLVVIPGLAYIWLRFSLASPLTYARGRIDVLGSWALTKGRVAAITQAYLLAAVLCAVVYLVGGMLIAALMAAATGGLEKLPALASPSLDSVASFLSPPRILLLALQSALSALILPIILCPAIEIYGSLDMQNVWD